MRKLKIGLIDDNQDFRHFFLKVISQAGLSFSPVLWSSPQDYLFSRQIADILLTALEFSCPGPDGRDLLKYFLMRKSGAPCLVLTNTQNLHIRKEALELKPAGMIWKDDLPQLRSQLPWIFHSVLQGGAFLSPAVTSEVLEELHRIRCGSAPGTCSERVDLTLREIQVLSLVSRGITVKESAASLGISVHTLRVHIKNIYRKFKVGTLAELLYQARDQGII